ncbi:hypothetical protein J3458_001799 [Metarhizium acridum]|uniref:uncharacterized protein n=1 Tax=Metarhizium acridum TaxID=92637 RepID=UPI001C6B3942|nr:hypothetical protein J3458_001799 [Metarhizium acridum]
MCLLPTTIINYLWQGAPLAEMIGRSCRTPRLLEFHRAESHGWSTGVDNNKVEVGTEVLVSSSFEVSHREGNPLSTSTDNSVFPVLAMSSSNPNSWYGRFVSQC